MLFSGSSLSCCGTDLHEHIRLLHHHPPLAMNETAYLLLATASVTSLGLAGILRGTIAAGAEFLECCVGQTGGGSAMAAGADEARGRWPLSGAFALGAMLGGMTGLAWGWIDYGTFDIARFSNYFIGCAVLGGFGFLALAALRNWARRNPV